MLPFFGITALVIAAATTSQPAPAFDTAAPPAIAAPVLAAAPSRRNQRQQQAVNAQPSGQPSHDELLEERLRMRVLSPALSGDGGG